MSTKTFTHKELAQRLNVSETTIKSYRRKFPGCIPVFSQGKPIRFTQEALPVCKLIRDLFEQGMSVQEVATRLGVSFPELRAPLGHVLAQVAAPSGLEQESSAGLPEVKEGREAAPESAGQGLSQSFSTAIGGLAQSVVSLTRQQSAILERLAGLEEKMLGLVAPGSEQSDLPREGGSLGGQAQVLARPEQASTDAENAQPDWANELAGRLEGMEQAILQTLQNLGGQLKDTPLTGANQNGANSENMQQHLLQETGVETGGERAGKVNVLPWKQFQGATEKNMHLSDIRAQSSVSKRDFNRGACSTPEQMPASGSGSATSLLPASGSGQQGEAMGKGLSQTSTFKTDRDDLEDYLRCISTLPLALKGADGYTGLAGRGPFSLNDFKAILAQTFMPPQHYVGRWEVASGEFWYILEQPEEKNIQNSIRLHLCPVRGTRGAPMLEVVRFLVGGSHEHPTALYAFVQELLG